MNVVARLTIEALRDLGIPALPRYEAALAEACVTSPPPYGERSYGDKYRSIAVDPHWMAGSLVTSAEREGDGANRLWSLAACTSDPKIADEVKRHAVDESRHARWYIVLLDLAFPGAVEASLRPHLQALSPGYSLHTPLKPVEGSLFAHPVTVDDLIQMNIAEIRTRIHHLLQRPVLLAHAPPSAWERMKSILDPLLLDETRHIAYTAELIENFALLNDEQLVRELMNERLRDFNVVTNAELASGIFESA
jgi:hypothetical protein